MRAARRFVHTLEADGVFYQARRIHIDLYGSIACNGRDQGTDRAILAGLCGDAPDRLFRTLSLGLGTPASIMPTYQNFAEQLAKPDKGRPEAWAKARAGTIPDPDLQAVQGVAPARPRGGGVERSGLY